MKVNNIKLPNKNSKNIAKINLNGAFIYYPKGISLSGKDISFDICDGFLINNGTIKEAIQKMSGKEYKQFLSKFRKLK